MPLAVFAHSLTSESGFYSSAESSIYTPPSIKLSEECQNGYCCHSSLVRAGHSTDAYDPIDGQFAACGYAQFWGKFCSLEMLFFLAGLVLATPQRTQVFKSISSFLFPSRI